MKLLKFFSCLFFTLALMPAFASDLFFEDQPVQDGLNVFQLSDTFSEIYEKLDEVKWGGKSINLAIENLEKLNKNAHIAATDERVVLVWGNSIIANYPRPQPKDWKSFGEITTAIILKLRENDSVLKAASENEIYQITVDTLMKGIDEKGRYIYSKSFEANNDGKILTSVGLEGEQDEKGNYRVLGVYKDSPADKANIEVGDLIVKINGQKVSDMDSIDIYDAFSGMTSGTLKLNVVSPYGEKKVVIRKASIVLADADIIFHKIEKNTGILEIVVHDVSDNAVAIINEALANYSDKISGIILDLRATGGDSEKAAAKLAGLFVGQVPVMRIAETAKEELEVVPGGNAQTDAALVVLTSNMTSGTAEAIAATIYENNRGVLVGTPTSGQTRLASIIDLENGSALELMNKSIKTGKGKIIENRGVFPIVCLSNIRSNAQQNAFFLNVINNEFNAKDFNKVEDLDVEAVRKGCPSIVSGSDEDAVSMAVATKILTDEELYNNLISAE